jgi:23S rRNA (uracil1939-C5)-methyltransferase
MTSAPKDEWLVEQLVVGGDGMARLVDGRVGFATGAFPGDRLRAERVTNHKTWVRADEWTLLAPSPDRVAPPCPVANECGGCDWMALSRSAQLLGKASLVRQALRRAGGLQDLPEEVPVRSEGPDLGYRNRLRLHVDRAGRVGMFARASHDLVEIPSCAVSDPSASRALQRIRELAPPGALARWKEIEIRVAPIGPPVSVWLMPREQRAATAHERELLASFNGEWLAAEAGTAGEDQRWPLPGEVELRVPPGGFVQVNSAVNFDLVSELLVGVKQRGISTFIELYAGAGNFTLPLLRAGLRGVAIERAGASIRAARRAARAQDLSDDAFVAGDGPRELLRRGKPAPDLVLLDPPRTGARDAVDPLLRAAPRFIAFCACDPATLARDVKALSTGYSLESVTAFDMFPHTHHVETLLWLRRNEP